MPLFFYALIGLTPFLPKHYNNSYIFQEKIDTLVLTIEDELKYENAYKMILMDYSNDCEFIVHPKLSSTYYSFFLEELNIGYEYAFRLDEFENNTYLRWKGNDNSSQIRNKYVIEFSKLIAGKELFCCVSELRFFKTYMGDTIYYYFSFDEDGRIKCVHKKLMHGL